MALRFADDVTLLKANTAVDEVDAGSGPGKLKIYSGAQVVDPDAGSPSGLLATLTLSDPAFGAAAIVGDNAEALANAITDETSASAGTAASYEVTDSDDNVKWTGTVTATGGGGDLELNSTTIGAGGTVSVSSFTYRQKRNP